MEIFHDKIRRSWDRLTFIMDIHILVRRYLYIETPTSSNPGWHDDVSKWKHFPRYCPFVRGIHQSPVNSSHKGQWRGALTFYLAATKQLYEWFGPSVRLSVCLSVTPFWLCSHHPIIMKFSKVITNDKCDVHAKGQGQRSKVKVTEVITQLSRFRTVNTVWIHIRWWNDA